MNHHSNFISVLAQIYKPKTYLELGLYEGETWRKVLPYCERAVGVDTIDRNITGGEIHIKTTTEFFRDFNENVDMVFIDADHRYESVKKDFSNSIKLLNYGGVIILHDTDPSEDSLLDFGYCGDSYRMVDLIEDLEEYNIVTLPMSSPGLSVVTRKKETRMHIRKL